MSENKLDKDLAKLSPLVNGTCHGSLQPREVFLLSDSKGRCIQRQISSHDRIKIEVIYKGGARVTNDIVCNIACRKIRTSVSPVVLIWFGTCEFTHKIDNEITLNEEAIGEVDRVIASYENYKKRDITIKQTCNCYFY